MKTGGRAIVHYMRTGVVCDVFLPAASVTYSGADAQGDAPAQKESGLMAEAPDTAPPEAFRILVVEDSFLLVMTIQAMLDDLGWVAVGPAARGTEALALAQSEVFDAALLDVNLDGETTWDVASVLRTRGIPFVFGTGYDVSSVLPDDLAGSAVIAKPYHSRDLEQRLREVIAASNRNAAGLKDRISSRPPQSNFWFRCYRSPVLGGALNGKFAGLVVRPSQNDRLIATCGLTDELVFLPAAENAAPTMIPAELDQLYSIAGAMTVLLFVTLPVCTTTFARVEPVNANPRP
jgi:CheY-like chemotaxis protein